MLIKYVPTGPVAPKGAGFAKLMRSNQLRPVVTAWAKLLHRIERPKAAPCGAGMET